jgi:predicted secreted hydrolase
MLDKLTKQNIAHSLWMREYDESKIPSDILDKINSEKNSNERFTSRFCTRVGKMMQSPLSFITSRKERYLKILEYAKKNDLSPQAMYASNLLLGPESVLGYEPVSTNLDFDSKKLDLPQLKSQVGWHFFVGNYKDNKGNHYSVELMFWHYTQLPPELAAQKGLSDIENQTLEIHLAICDPQKQIQYRATTSVVAGTTGLIVMNDHPNFEYKMGKNTIIGLSKSGELFPVRLVCLGYDLSDKENPNEIEIDIYLENKKGGYFLEGENGFAPSVDGIGTLYYSSALLTLLEGHESSLKINGKKITLKEGRAWYDHQWGTGFMPSGAPRDAVMRAMQNLSIPAPGGWDWFMFQFYQNDQISKEGEVQICVSALHTNDNLKYYYQTGANSPGVMKAQFSGKFIDPHNNVSDLTGEMQVLEWTKVNFSPDPEVYPPTDTWYPNKYMFSFSNPSKVDKNSIQLPSLLSTLIVAPLIHQGAQSGFFGTGLQYTEGGTIVRDKNNNEIGRGFAEGTNWADCSKGILKLIGLPVNTETLGYLSSPKVSSLMKFLSKIEVLVKAKQLKQILKDAKGL